MFPVRGLLAHIACPDQSTDGKQCERQSCPFDHSRHQRQEKDDIQSSNTSVNEASASSSKDEGSSAHTTGTSARPLKRERENGTPNDGPSETPAAKRPIGQPQYRSPLDRVGSSSSGPRNAYAAAKLGKAVPASAHSGRSDVRNQANSESGTSAQPSASNEAGSSSAEATRSFDPILSAPLIPKSSHSTTSQVPLSIRQSSLRTYFTTFTTLYLPLLPTRGAKDVSDAVRNLLKQAVHRLASEDALASEQDIYRTSYAKTMTYRNSVRTTLVSITKRQKADHEAQERGRFGDTLGALGIRALRKAKQLLKDVESKSLPPTAIDAMIAFLRTSRLVGTTKEVTQKVKEHEEQEKGRLEIASMEKARLIASQEDLLRTDYPIPLINGSEDNEDATNLIADASGDGITAVWGAGNTQHDLVGETRTCERCKTDFVVQPLDTDESIREACCYHWGKRRYVRDGASQRGPRLPRWTCCDALDEATTFASSSLSQIAVSSGIVASGEGRAFANPAAARSSGCTRGPHVFKEEDDKSLHAREAFVASQDLCQSDGAETGTRHEVLALDCELVSTTAGMSLARLTVLDQAGGVMLDRYIRPRAAILDYNTRFSGIREEDIPANRDTKHSLEGVRAELGRIMTPSTVLIGHGLENDLKALRLVHMCISDSVLLYPHPKGLPYRLSLRELSEKHLGRFIQQQGDVSGHDPEEDARAALDLVRLRFRTIREQQAAETRIASAPSQPSPSPKPIGPSPSASSVAPKTPPAAPRAMRPDGSRIPGPSAPSARATASLFMPKRKTR